MKIYHLCPSGSLWIFNQKEVKTREEGEKLFNKKAKPGDVLKIDIPGQDTIKITKIINLPKPMSKASQFKMSEEEAKKDLAKKQEDYRTRANAFMTEYTVLTDKYGIFLNARLEFSNDGVVPKITLENKVLPIDPNPKGGEEIPTAPVAA